MTGLPSETFRIKPGKRSKLYLIVHVAKNLTELRKVMKAFGGENHPEQLAAVVACYETPQTDLVGVVFMPRQYIGVGLVTHELAHAAFRVVERYKRKVKHWEPHVYSVASQPKDARAASSEELYATVLENLSRSFWKEIYARGMDK